MQRLQLKLVFFAGAEFELVLQKMNSLTDNTLRFGYYSHGIAENIPTKMFLKTLHAILTCKIIVIGDAYKTAEVAQQF